MPLPYPLMAVLILQLSTNVSIALQQQKPNVSVKRAQTMTREFECQCCAFSAAVSSYDIRNLWIRSNINRDNRYYGVCPTTDPSELGLDTVIKEIQEYATSVTGTCSNLDSTTCLEKFNISSPDGSTYVNPADLPTGGTEKLSTTTGVGYPLTSPPGGETMTVVIFSATYTVTAAPYNAKNVAATSSTGSINTATTGITASSTSTGSKKSLGISAFNVPSIEVYGVLLFVAFMVGL
ncbi:hypothetical protein N7495_000013 [Penicillium taxi]|uniref:uncharacterized protein n=1 Tax=Penicillium taxi TaxID=168475 RepID=UPI002544EFAC|nr:uncharacterized protein N7495_000013 [Penicillium taxi]KAJ5907331.1 hypothetical protein N7495_000013 [Penicillium taxi]